MKRATRYLTGLLTAATLLGTMGVGTAQAALVPYPAVPPAKTVEPGMRIKFDNHTEAKGACTIGAVGTDSAGRKVGITAGHCNPTTNPDYPNAPAPYYPGPNRQTHTLDNTHPVFDWRDLAAGPIGWIRWVSHDERYGFDETIGKLDYMVIEFAPNITVSSHMKTAPKYGATNGTAFDPATATSPGPIEAPAQDWLNMNALYADAAGNPKEAQPGQTICQVGSTTVQGYAQSNDPKQARCGLVLDTANGLIDAWAQVLPADSGGPAFVDGSNTKWAGIVTAHIVRCCFPPQNFYRYTSAKKILDDLNPRGITGSGFQMANN